MKATKIIGNLLIAAVLVFGLIQLNSEKAYAVALCTDTYCGYTWSDQCFVEKICTCYPGGPVISCVQYCTPNRCGIE